MQFFIERGFDCAQPNSLDLISYYFLEFGMSILVVRFEHYHAHFYQSFEKSRDEALGVFSLQYSVLNDETIFRYFVFFGRLGCCR